jgi:hypothetical protein
MNGITRERLSELNEAYQIAVEEIINREDGGDVPVDTEMSVKLSEPIQELATLNQEGIQSSAPYEVSIRQVNNGFVVLVGCQTFAFEKFETASKYMAMYFENPSETIHKHYAGTLFK